jgi:hypothetical protein
MEAELSQNEGKHVRKGLGALWDVECVLLIAFSFRTQIKMSASMKTGVLLCYVIITVVSSPMWLQRKTNLF